MIFKEILFRIQQQFGHRSDAETARFLGIKPQTLNGWKQTNSPDYNLIFEKCSTMDLHWLLTGERAPSAARYDPEETMERAEAKQQLSELLVSKTMILLETGKNEELQNEIEVLRNSLKFI
jgi:hypothetical protein